MKTVSDRALQYSRHLFVYEKDGLEVVEVYDPITSKVEARANVRSPNTRERYVKSYTQRYRIPREAIIRGKSSSEYFASIA